MTQDDLASMKRDGDRCLQCFQYIKTSSYVVIYDKDTNEEGYLHSCCVRAYSHQRNFKVLEEHVH